MQNPGVWLQTYTVGKNQAKIFKVLKKIRTDMLVVEQNKWA